MRVCEGFDEDTEGRGGRVQVQVAPGGGITRREEGEEVGRRRSEDGIEFFGTNATSFGDKSREVMKKVRARGKRLPHAMRLARGDGCKTGGDEG